MIDWDDLRIFITAARSRSFGEAAQRLGMDATTVGRRIQRLETALRSTLFVRSRQGLTLTAVGARLRDAGGSVEQAIETASAHAPGEAVSGVVRISASEGFGTRFIAPALPAFLADKPGLSIELAANSGFLSPANREVDMAVTLTLPQSPRLTVERLTDYDLQLYASKAYLARAGRPRGIDDLRRMDLVGYVDDLIYADALRYLDDVAPDLRPRITSSSIAAQQVLVQAGAGIAVLPRFMAVDDAALEVVLEDQVRLRRTFWISTHHDLQATARLRAIRTWLLALVDAAGPMLRAGEKETDR